VEQCVERILAQFALGSAVEFADVFSPESTRGEVVATFLALLELIRLKVVRAVQQERFGPIQLHLAVADLAEAQARAQEMGQVGMVSAVEEESDDGRPGDQS
jgi:segregation and condensation protein A